MLDSTKCESISLCTILDYQETTLMPKSYKEEDTAYFVVDYNKIFYSFEMLLLIKDTCYQVFMQFNKDLTELELDNILMNISYSTLVRLVSFNLEKLITGECI